MNKIKTLAASCFALITLASTLASAHPAMSGNSTISSGHGPGPGTTVYNPHGPKPGGNRPVAKPLMGGRSLACHAVEELVCRTGSDGKEFCKRARRWICDGDG